MKRWIPALLLVLPLTASALTLQWEKSSSPGVVKYFIYAAKTADGPYEKIGETAETRFTIPDEPRAYTVSAVNKDGVESDRPLSVAWRLPAAKPANPLAANGESPKQEGVLISEDWESKKLPAGWTVGGGRSIGYTTRALDGTQSLLLKSNPDEEGSWARSPQFSAQTAPHGFFLFRVRENPSEADDTKGSIASWLSGSEILAELQIDKSRVPTLRHGKATQSGQPLTLGTIYYAWLDYAAGTGSDGKAALYLSTTSTKPATPTLEIKTGTSTEPANALYLGQPSAHNATLIFDKIRVSTAEIGSTPP